MNFKVKDNISEGDVIAIDPGTKKIYLIETNEQVLSVQRSCGIIINADRAYKKGQHVKYDLVDDVSKMQAAIAAIGKMKAVAKSFKDPDERVKFERNANKVVDRM